MRKLTKVLGLSLLLLLLAVAAFGQETTGGLQGTVKDANGAVVPKAVVNLTGTSLVGSKSIETDASGYYRFANLPPGNYVVTVKAPGFETLKREGITIEVGHLPSLDLALKVGSEATVVEVTAEAPLIDITTTHTATNVTNDVIADVPHGRSFQSVIQFAPSARNEPLMGATSAGAATGGTGGSTPGSSGNGLSYGFSVGGASDSENSYLVEGQDTANIAGGYSKANVPFEFIQEVQVKSGGTEAEHGGALGGVVNVVMKKGSNAWHGELFATLEASGMDGSPDSYGRYDPNTNVDPATGDVAFQTYQPKKDRFIYTQPGVTIGGPIVKDRLWFFAGFAPYYTSLTRTVDFSASPAGNLGLQAFNQNQLTYYTTGRLDATVTQNIRLFGSWLYQLADQKGANLPIGDDVSGLLNTSVQTPITTYSHGISWVAPNQTVNIGADITITPKIVSTTRFGYFFENYHDDSWPTSGTDFNWRANAVNAVLLSDGVTKLSSVNPALAQPVGHTTPLTTTYTTHNANKHYQFDQDVAAFKSGWWGTHNFKAGYQLNHLSNSIHQANNVPWIRYYPARGYSSPGTSVGVANCAAIEAENVANGWSANTSKCAGDAGYMYAEDFITSGNVVSWNHGLFIQDAWTLGKGLTINAGLRIEKENIPAPPGMTLTGRTIDFDWSDKIEPRVGAAWDVLQNGKIKVFGSYGVTNDIMKLLLAMTSFGGQNWDNCYYAVDHTYSPSTQLLRINDRFCPSAGPTTGANWAGGTIPTGLRFIENYNLRPQEPVSPGVKPYRQHESTLGADFQISKNYAFEARWDRRRLDHILEDSALTDTLNGEIYTIVNPGEGVNKTIDGYAQYLGSLGEGFGITGAGYYFNAAAFGTCPTCPNMPKAVRSYDGLELRLTKSMSQHWSGMVAYTYSSLRGNYAGLTNTDQTDGGAPGRNSPDTSRAFDEPTEYFQADGASSNGPLATDRPNTFKGYAYYQVKEGKRNNTTFGLFQQFYQGSPIGSYMDVGGSFGDPSYGQYLWGRGKYLAPSNMVVDPTSGAITLQGTPYTARTPWFIQTDLNLGHEIKLDTTNEHKVLAFEATIGNLFNQRSVVQYYSGMNATTYFGSFLAPQNLTLGDGAAGYQAVLQGYNIQQWINSTFSPIVKSSWYGQPLSHQLSRTMRLKVAYRF